MPIRPLLLAALLLPQAALALPWDGTYRLSEDADCEKVGEEGGALHIGEGVLQGVGSSCRMTEPVDVLDLDATLYVMACEGEGETWTERAMLMRAAEGDAIYLAWRGYVFRYDRCPEPEGASAEERPAGEEEAPETEGEDASGNGEEADPASDEAGDEAQEEPASEGEEDPAAAAPPEDE